MKPMAGTRWDVSVVIPTYNRAHLIGATLDTVLAQTHQPAEVVVVDDGSTDETEAVVSRYRQPVRYERIRNSGVCVARNVGVRLSSTRWVALCDSDDLWRPQKLEWQMRLLQRAPDVEYVFCDFVLETARGTETATKFGQAPPGFWEPGRRQLDDDCWEFEEALYSRLLRYQPIFPSTITMSRDFFERVGGLDDRWSRNPGEDIEFVLRCMQRAPVGAVARPLVGIRKHTSNFSGDRLRSSLGVIKILRHARVHHQPHGMRYAGLIDEWIARETLNAVAFAFAEGRLGVVRDLVPDVPPAPRSPKLRLKLAVARLPEWAARPLCRALICAADALARPRTVPA
jgi:glycosyltransferase involved in cell wall biosynthesis